MGDDDSNPAIPAWQRAQKQQPAPSPSEGSEKGQSAADQGIREYEPKEIEIATPVEPAATAAAEEMSTEETTPTLQLQHMQTFLEDPAVKNAPMEKKRAFFESKGISKEQIDQALNTEQSPLSVNDFESFKQTQDPSAVASPPPRQQQQQASGPPIITYPEFLVEAHKPPPLITPARIVNTAYIVSGVAAMLYGASKYLVTPMSDSLTSARHDFATHSQSKIDEMNERLTKLVSKVPAPKAEQPDGTAEDDESVTSDPTELYHRDMGTQTSPPPSRTSSLSSEAAEKKDPTDHAIKGLDILHSHLSDELARSTTLETANKTRQESLNKLRSYLDTLMYTNTAYGPMWNSSENSWSDVGAEGKKEGKDKGKKKEEDVVEELKREIRGVKGVLLSAKRFPGVVGRAGGV
ncbi:uncharacterized protein LTR77_010232 [Saxophila tyrrhenica]|uniref:Peroxisomal membrane protein PEX14 n=1 Tax=Saxophila tyrrhenica TaxID=1690608 RepID=A0AAV9NX81_9PEZI|nr:hypothetical protein LTR77_010232 [Saxophila tyrrhenica]